MTSERPFWQLTQEIIGAAQEVHRELGPGFLEGVYELSLLRELAARGLEAVQQARLEVRYKGEVVGVYYADLLVQGTVLCELKATRSLAVEHEAQLVHYLKATGITTGLILNFGTSSLQVKRKIHTKRQR
jgi:GxxExxY protein